MRNVKITACFVTQPVVTSSSSDISVLSHLFRTGNVLQTRASRLCMYLTYFLHIIFSSRGCSRLSWIAAWKAHLMMLMMKCKWSCWSSQGARKKSDRNVFTGPVSWRSSEPSTTFGFFPQQKPSALIYTLNSESKGHFISEMWLKHERQWRKVAHSLCLHQIWVLFRHGLSLMLG